MRFFIVGANGHLGSRLCPFLESKGHIVFKLSRNEKEIKHLFSKINPQVIINLAANTNVDECEQNIRSAFHSNIEPLNMLSKYINTNTTHLVQISTDQVYSGKGPHEESKANPCNVYGLTKYSGELIARSMNASILRTNYVGKSLLNNKKSLTDWLVNSLKNKKPIMLYNDIIFNPVHADYLCEVILKVSEEKVIGTFNLGSSSSITKADFFILLAKELNLDLTNIEIGSSIRSPIRAKRPSDMSMIVTKIEKDLSIKIPEINQTILDTSIEYIN